MRWCRISVGQKIHAECSSKWLCRLTSALAFHAERSSNSYPSHHLGTVVGQGGYLLWASAPPGESLTANQGWCRQTRKLLCGGSVSQLGPKPFLCATPPSWRVGSCSHWAVVVGLSCSDRGHHVPALTVTSGGWVSGFDVARWGTPCGYRRFSFFLSSAPFRVSFLSVCDSDVRSTLRRP